MKGVFAPFINLLAFFLGRPSSPFISSVGISVCIVFGMLIGQHMQRQAMLGIAEHSQIDRETLFAEWDRTFKKMMQPYLDAAAKCGVVYTSEAVVLGTGNTPSADRGASRTPTQTLTPASAVRRATPTWTGSWLLNTRIHTPSSYIYSTPITTSVKTVISSVSVPKPPPKPTPAPCSTCSLASTTAPLRKIVKFCSCEPRSLTFILGGLYHKLHSITPNHDHSITRWYLFVLYPLMVVPTLRRTCAAILLCLLFLELSVGAGRLQWLGFIIRYRSEYTIWYTEYVVGAVNRVNRAWATIRAGAGEWCTKVWCVIRTASADVVNELVIVDWLTWIWNLAISTIQTSIAVTQSESKNTHRRLPEFTFPSFPSFPSSTSIPMDLNPGITPKLPELPFFPATSPRVECTCVISSPTPSSGDVNSDFEPFN